MIVAKWEVHGEETKGKEVRRDEVEGRLMSAERETRNAYEPGEVLSYTFDGPCR